MITMKRILRMAFPPVKLSKISSILSIQPHPDDTDIALGASIAWLTSLGVAVDYLTVTDDHLLHPIKQQDGTETTQRRVEQRGAADILGVRNLYWIGYADGSDWSEYQLRLKIIDYIRRLKPDIVLAPDPWLTYEAHPDHRKTGYAAAAACMLYSFDLDPSLLDRTPLDSSYELKAAGFYYTASPNTRNKVGTYRNKKFEAIACHRSQFTPESLATLSRYDSLHGKTCGKIPGIQYCEGLRVLPPTLLHCVPESSLY